MLTHLHIQNLALVDDVSLTFGPGLNVISGETGAGKSILMGALRLLLGDRADRSLIRAGAEVCSAQAVFELVEADGLDGWLEEHGLPATEEGALIVRRRIKAAGGGQAFVNDHPVTLQTMKSLGDRLIDMHGPYDHQALLRTDAQRDVLDASAGLAKDRAVCARAAEAVREVDQRLEALQGDDASIQEQVDLLSYRVSEIAAAEVTVEEYEGLLQEHGMQANAAQILESAREASELLDGEEGSALNALGGVQHAMESLVRMWPDRAAPWMEEAEQAAGAVRELALSVREAVDEIDADPARLDWLEQRRGQIESLMGKYGGTVEVMLERLEEWQARLSDLETRDEQVQALTQEREAAMAGLTKAADALHKKRVKAGKKLAAGITTHLQDLGFPEAQFDVELVPMEPGRTGRDQVDFGFAPNPGEPMRKLRQIASSGEIARVMLAVKAVLAGHDQVPVMIFDEIDSNVGGEMGASIGRKMRAVAEHHQVITITHLPQAAVFGAQHLAVHKGQEDGRTLTRVHHIEGEDRVQELARMLGGVDFTPGSEQHAREMLDAAAKG